MEKVLFYTYLLQDIDLQKRNLGDNDDDGDDDDDDEKDEDEDYNNADDSCWIMLFILIIIFDINSIYRSMETVIDIRFNYHT